MRNWVLATPLLLRPAPSSHCQFTALDFDAPERPEFAQLSYKMDL